MAASTHYATECKLVVELDGSIHRLTDQNSYDEQRTSGLGLYGIRVIRFRNEEVHENLDGVLMRIAVELISHD